MTKTAKKPLKATAKNIRWQIRAREQIQELMLRQWALLNENHHFTSRQDFYQIVRMTQTAFSLWRSAFLTNVRNNENEILQKSKENLERILTTNAIGFSDEFGNRDLTVAYYNNNAKYRLERECDYHPELKNEGEFKELLEIREDDDTKRRSQKKIWNICYHALNKCLSKFEDRVKQQHNSE
jgi:hypothetical protein